MGPPGLMVRLADNQGGYLQSYGLTSKGAIITGLLRGSILAFSYYQAAF